MLYSTRDGTRTHNLQISLPTTHHCATIRCLWSGTYLNHIRITDYRLWVYVLYTFKVYHLLSSDIVSIHYWLVFQSLDQTREMSTELAHFYIGVSRLCTPILILVSLLHYPIVLPTHCFLFMFSQIFHILNITNFSEITQILQTFLTFFYQVHFHHHTIQFPQITPIASIIHTTTIIVILTSLYNIHTLTI